MSRGISCAIISLSSTAASHLTSSPAFSLKFFACAQPLTKTLFESQNLEARLRLLYAPMEAKKESSLECWKSFVTVMLFMLNLPYF